MAGLTLLLTAAALGFGLSQWLRLPAIPLLIVLGFALSRLGIDVEGETLDNLLDIGLAFLVFFAGLALTPDRFKGQFKPVLWVAAVQFLAASGAGFLVALLLGFDTTSALYVGGALSTSSTLVVVRQLYRIPSAIGSTARLVTGVLLVQDLAIILLIVVVGSASGGVAGVAGGVAELSVMAAAAFAIQRWVPKIARRGRIDEELLLVSALAILFLFLGAAAQIGLSIPAGAFFAGFALSGFPLGGLVRSGLESVNTFFLAVFFAVLGAVIEIPDTASLFATLVLVATVFVVTIPLVTAVAEWKGGLTTRSAVTAGLLVSQTSEFSVILAIFGLELGHIDESTVSVIALVAVISMAATPFFASSGVAQRLLQLHPLRRRLDTSTDRSGHVVVLGYGESGQWITRPLQNAGFEFVVIDNDPAVVQQLRNRHVEVIYGDAGDEKTLERVGVGQARFILASLFDPEDIAKVIENAPGVPVFARVFEESDATKIEALGGHVVVNSLSTADRFMEWFEVFEEERAAEGAAGHAGLDDPPRP